MSVEREMRVKVPPDQLVRVQALRASADAARDRLIHAPIGDRAEIVRHGHVTSALDAIAYELLCSGQGRLTDEPEGHDVLALTWPFAFGSSQAFEPGERVTSPAEAWRSEHERPSRGAATYERFLAQLLRWTEWAAHGDEPPAVCPTGVQNRALTEALRATLDTTEGGGTGVDAKVVYRDGSAARDLPLRSVPMAMSVPDDGRQLLKMTLLSVRHFAMDAEVDGAWLRNREISLRRPHGQTDELVYQQSIEQFEQLTQTEPLTLWLYQTGLEPANVGFYRALVDHHRRNGGNHVVVVPQYYAGGNDFAPGTPWVIA